MSQEYLLLAAARSEETDRKKMNKNQRILTGMLAFLALSLAETATATTVTGSANILGNVNVSGSGIDFMPDFGTTMNAFESGDFDGLTGGTIQSLSNGPSTGSTFIKAFMSFTEGVAAPIYFDLTYIAPGAGTLAGCTSSAIGSACTPLGSPFTLFQLPSNTVIAALQLNGNLYMGSADTGVSEGTSIFSTQTALNGTIPEIVSLLESGQSLTGVTYSASFMAAPVPEPSMFPLWSAGLLAAGLGLLHKKR